MPKVVDVDNLAIATANSDRPALYNEFKWDRRKPTVHTGETRRTEGTLFDQVLRTGSSVYLEDIVADGVLTRYPGLADAAGNRLRSLVVVPLIVRGAAFGSPALASRTTGAYGDDDVRLSEGIGASVAGAVANAKLLGEVEAWAIEEELLAEVRRIVSSSLSLGKVYGRLAEGDLQSSPLRSLCSDHKRIPRTAP